MIASNFAKMRDSFSTEQKYLDLFMGYSKPGSSILDLGCGSSDPITSYLIDHGFKLMGVSASAELLKIAKINCPEMECIYGDRRDIELDEQYDTIIVVDFISYPKGRSRKNDCTLCFLA